MAMSIFLLIIRVRFWWLSFCVTPILQSTKYNPSTTQKFPTLKYGDPAALDIYNGPRSYDDLAAFAEENLKPICSPENLSACDDEEKELIQKYQNMPDEEIQQRIKQERDKLKQTKKSFDAAVDRLQKEYQALLEAKERRVESITKNDLRILKAIQKAKAQGVTGPSGGGKDEL
jgi:hypothetical protein